MLTRQVDNSPKDDNSFLVRHLPQPNNSFLGWPMRTLQTCGCTCCLQNVLRNTGIAELLLVSKSFVLECWPAEEFALENGRPVSTTVFLVAFDRPLV